MTAFTPGPWHANSGQVYSICDPAESRRSDDIAYIRGDKDSEEVKANTRLIVAAPDLYSALERLVNCPDCNLDELEPETRKALRQAWDALSKVNYE
jgi:hypothetical protein